MRKFTFKIFALLALMMWSIMPLMSQVDYGSDVIVKNTATDNQRKPSLTVASNGWLYAGFVVNNAYFVYKSTNNGQTWAQFFTYSSAATYDAVKIAVCGAAPYKVFVAVLRHSSSTNYEIYIDEYDGTTAAFITEPIWYTFNTDIYDIDIASDYLFPGGGATPYSVGLLYSVHAGTDSVTFVLSTNGGTTFSGKKSVATTGQWFGKVSLAYGRSSSWLNGRYFAAWENKTAFNAPLGHIMTSHTTTYVYSPFTTPVTVDNASNGFLNKLRNPKIAVQYNNVDNDSANVTAAIICERFWGNLDNDIVGLYNKRAVSGNTWNYFLVDNSSSTNCKQPDINYDSYYDNFLVTYWDSTHTYLPYVVKGMNFATPFTWAVVSANYNSNTTMGSLLQPYPVVEINNVLHQAAHLWSREGTGSNGVVMFDAEYSTVGISETISYNNDKISNIYPNPVYSNASIEFELNKPEVVQINVYDMSGKKVSNLYNNQTPQGKNTVSFNVDNLANGNYIIELVTSQSRLTEKMIVAHQ